MRLEVFCPAKLNLFLAVGPPDKKGWHPIRTIFQAIDFGDILTLEAADRDEFEADVDWLPTENSIVRALGLLRRAAPVPPVKMGLTKRVPPQAGLGGGSSNAAGILRGIPKLFGIEVGAERLNGIARGLGADVPFFLVGGRAKAEGYGEVLSALPDSGETHVLVVKPDVDCPTREMYAMLDGVPREWRDFPDPDELYNDFERIAPAPCHRAIEMLSAFGAEDAGLSGSGSAVFGVFPDHTSTLTAARLMCAEGYPQSQMWVTRSLARAESLHIQERY